MLVKRKMPIATADFSVHNSGRKRRRTYKACGAGEAETIGTVGNEIRSLKESNTTTLRFVAFSDEIHFLQPTWGFAPSTCSPQAL